MEKAIACSSYSLRYFLFLSLCDKRFAMLNVCRHKEVKTIAELSVLLQSPNNRTILV
jgi:hypothetical protein